jgi:cytochrome bd-type quinol oxidase subunit 2
MSLSVSTVILSIVAYHGHRRAWRGTMSEPRVAVDAVDLAAACIFLLAAAFLIASCALLPWPKGFPQEMWPVVAFAASGLVLTAARSALGLPITRRQNVDAAGLKSA